MMKFIAILMVISAINDGVISQLANGSDEVMRMSDWPIRVLHRINQYRDLNTTRESIEEELWKIDELAVILDAVTEKINLDCDNIMKILIINNIREELVLEDVDLCRHIQKVDHFFKDSRQYEYDGSFSNKTLETFCYEALWGDTNLPDVLEDIRQSLASIIYSSGLSPAQHAILNLQYECDTHISTQQQFYYTYIQLLMSEMKGLLTMERIYLTKRLMNETGDKYIAELDLAKRTSISRLTAYYDMLDLAITISPKHIRRCDITKPKYGTDIIELRQFSRVKIFNKKSTLKDKCKGCPNQTELQEMSSHLPATIYNCTNLGPYVKACPSNRRSPRNYLWWQDISNKYYGHSASCNRVHLIQGAWVSNSRSRLWGTSGIMCDLCACSVDLDKTRSTDTSTIWRISVADQVSDDFNNMVVTGIRFVTENNALHIQIHQSNFSHNGLVHHQGGWKKLGLGFNGRSMKQTNMQMSYVPLRHNRKTLYLDDINAPEGHVVTGIRFHLEGDSAFKVQVLAKPFDLNTGKVDPFGGSWLDAANNPVRSKDYERKRIAIELDNSDDPTRNEQYLYDLESNKMVKFTHTDIYKDAGQTTIPLFHARPVMTQPPFPLSAIGLSCRGKEGFGGIVALRIYSFDVSDHLSSLKIALNTTI